MRERERQMLEAILATPADDAPRLVYADWLSARGDPRGELIAVSCERHRLHNDTHVLDELRWRATIHREEELLRLHRAEWEAALPHMSWSRGFPSQFVGTGEELLAARQALALAPIDSVCLVADARPTIARVAAMPELTRVLELQLSGGASHSGWQLGDDGLTALARSPHLTNLRQLILGENGLGAAAALALARASWLPQLTALAIRDNALAPAGIVALAPPPRLSRLRELDLAGAHVGDDGAAALAGAGMTQLTWLCLPKTRIGARGATALSASAGLGAVTMLDLDGNLVGDDGATALAQSSGLPSLLELRLGGAIVGDAGAIAFASSHERGGLRTLELSGNVIGASGAQALAGSTLLTRLRRLVLTRNQLGVAGVTAFVDGTGLPSLHELGLADNIETDEDAVWEDWSGATGSAGKVRESLATTRARFASRPTLKIE